ncbi:hypothetical protein VPH35_088426 [Triticum aestivum]
MSVSTPSPSVQSSSSTHLSFLQVALTCTVLPTLSCINKEARCFSFSPRPVASPPEANTFKKTTISALYVPLAELGDEKCCSFYVLLIPYFFLFLEKTHMQ